MNDEYFLINKGKIRLLPPLNEKILDQIPIKEIEQYLRKKKLNNIFND